MDIPTATLLLLTALLAYNLLKPRRPLGPSPLAYLPGGLLHPLLRDPLSLTTVLTATAARYGPVFTLWIGLSRVTVTAHPADIAQILVSDFPRPRVLRNVWHLISPGGLFTMPRAAHAAARRALRAHFNPSMLRAFHSQIAAAAAELCHLLSAAARAPRGDAVDITRFLSISVCRVITNVAFASGMSRPQRREFAAVLETYADELMAELFSPSRRYLAVFGARRRLFACKRKVDAMCDAFIAKRLRETTEQTAARHPDILDAILALADGDMTVVKSLTVQFALTGSHTTNQMLSWCVYETSCHPEVVAQIQQELSDRLGARPWSDPLTLEDMENLPYIHKVWKETCRLHSSTSGVARIAKRDTVLKGSGVRLPKGAPVIAFMSYAQTDPNTWKDPLQFKPARWGSGSEKKEGDLVPAGAYVPFGVGPMSCAGRFLADYEGPLILAELHRRFKFTLACEPHEVVCRSRFVDAPMYAGGKGGDMNMSVPVRVELRSSP